MNASTFNYKISIKKIVKANIIKKHFFFFNKMKYGVKGH